jgi:anti-sigma factor RsiW
MPTLPNDEQQAELVAYLDGELDERAAQEFERRISQDAQLRAHADRLKKTWELLDHLPQPEPSPNFTSRTLDKVAVLRPTGSASVAQPLSKTTNAKVKPLARAWPKLATFAAVAAALFVGAFVLSGPLLRQASRPEDPKAIDEQMAQDLRVLDNLALYQYADDLTFLFGLDQPDQFGDEASH